METLTSLLSNTRNPDPNQELLFQRDGEASGGEAPDSAAISGDEASISDEREGKLELMEMPPTGDVCPICFDDFDVPCRAPCGHWYCGRCILQYWNFSAALQPCKCPMCLQCITKLIPEASLYHAHQAETNKVLRNVDDYNRLFVGGISGIMLKFLAIPLYIKRIFRELLNPDRPGVYLQEIRVIALLLGILLSFAPFNFLQIGRGNIIDLFDQSAFALSFIFYLVGLCLHWKRRRNIRELVDMPEGLD